MAEEHTNRSVGRPREFDEETVLTAVMDAFWRKGYEATSLSDLCDCTGLHKGSLYQAFGGKHQLFMQSLEHYADTRIRHVASAVGESESPLENIKAAVGKITEDAGSEKGCMMINSMVELSAHDPDVKAALQRIGEKRLRCMADLFGKAQQADEIRRELDPYKLARQLMITLAGSAAMVKGFLDGNEILETLDDMIESWT